MAIRIGQAYESLASLSAIAFLSPSPIELLVILVIALLVLGPSRLPQTARALGRGMRELRDSLQGAAQDLSFDEPEEPLDRRYASAQTDPDDGPLDDGPPFDDDLPAADGPPFDDDLPADDRHDRPPAAS